MSAEFQSEEKILAAFSRANISCTNALLSYSATAPKDRAATLSILVARFIGHSWLGLLRPIQNRFPDTVQDELIFAPDDARAILPREHRDAARGFDTFLCAAYTAVAENEDAILRGEKTGLFRLGTLQTIVDALADIHHFSDQTRGD